MTKEEFKKLLQIELENWRVKAETLEGTMKEQAIGRREELAWLLAQYDKKLKKG